VHPLGAVLLHNATPCGNLDLLKERNCDTMPIGSVKKPRRGQQTEDFWNMQVSGASAEPFFIITQEEYL